MVTTKAKLRFVHMAAQKARLVADQVRGKYVEEALDLLQFHSKNAAKVIKKVLNSAIANAEHNNGVDIDELKITSIHVDEGPTMKRWRARARGRANKIMERTCHITVQVTGE